MLYNELQDTINQSLKKGDTVVVETLRFLLSAVRNEAIKKYGADAEAKITDEDVLFVIKKQVKTHRESVEAFGKAGRTGLADREKAQLAILETYLPKELSDEELTEMLTQVVAEGGEFGPMMGKAMAKVQGKADGGRVAAMLKKLQK